MTAATSKMVIAACDAYRKSCGRKPVNGSFVEDMRKAVEAALRAAPASPAERPTEPREDQENIDWKARFESSQSLLARRTEALEPFAEAFREMPALAASTQQVSFLREWVGIYHFRHASEALSDLGNEEKQEVSSSVADRGSSQPAAVKSDSDGGH